MQKRQPKINFISISSWMGQNKRHVIMKRNIRCHFGHYCLMWMMHGRVVNNRINQIHEGIIRALCQDIIASFEKLLQRG